MSKEHKRQDTFMAKRTDTPLSWFSIDAKGKTLGRLASEIAKILRGKHKPNFTPHADTGDGVIVLNAGEIVVTGAKEARKRYYRYSGHPGGLRMTLFRDARRLKPTFMLEHAVKGMMPRTRLGRAQLRRLRLFEGGEHTHGAQKVISVNC